MQTARRRLTYNRKPVRAISRAFGKPGVPSGQLRLKILECNRIVWSFAMVVSPHLLSQKDILEIIVTGNLLRSIFRGAPG